LTVFWFNPKNLIIQISSIKFSYVLLRVGLSGRRFLFSPVQMENQPSDSEKDLTKIYDNHLESELVDKLNLHFDSCPKLVRVDNKTRHTTDCLDSSVDQNLVAFGLGQEIGDVLNFFNVSWKPEN